MPHAETTRAPQTNPAPQTNHATKSPRGSWPRLPEDPAREHLGLSIEPADPARDAATVRAWLAHPASSFWGMADYDDARVRAYLEELARDPHQSPWLLRAGGRPVAYAETYDPRHVALTEVHDAAAGEIGMHLLVAPAPERPADRVSGLSAAVMRAVLRHCFEDLGALRVVVEPDRRNHAVQAMNARCGFRARRLVDLPDKTALLSTLEREDFARVLEATAEEDGAGNSRMTGPTPALAHLTGPAMEAAQRHLVAKALAEFSHEHLLDPRPLDRETPTTEGESRRHGRRRWEVLAPDGTRYRFTARLMPLHHWALDEATLERRSAADEVLPLDAQELVVAFHEVLGLPEKLLGTYLEEIAATLASAAYKHERGGPSAEQLARGLTGAGVAADFQRSEAAMTEGHPAFVASNGRIGFDVLDSRTYAPEAGERFRYPWIAARRGLARLDLSAGLGETAHWENELGPETLEKFRSRIRAVDADPEDYLLLPVHPWQFRHRVAVSFAPDLADGRLIALGEAPDEYQPQQSVRTAFDRDRPERSYVKTALSIQNMGFLRGMSPEYMRATPAINDWAAEQVRTDPVLRAAGFDVLRERAAIGYTGDAYHRTEHKSAQQKMVAALWRESPLPRLGEGERLMTMAALLHRDAAGASTAAALVRVSGLDAEEWVRRYLRAYLVPVVHCLEVYELAFMPHGENLMLRLREGAVVGAFMKDIGEEAAVIGDRPLPEEIGRMRHPVDDAEAADLVLTDVVDGVLRHLAAHLDEAGTLPSARFWALAAEAVREAQGDLGRGAEHAAPRRRRLDLFVPEFAHSCLNRLQLRNTLEMVDLADASGSLIRSGTLRNPLVENA